MNCGMVQATCPVGYSIAYPRTGERIQKLGEMCVSFESLP